MNNPLRIRLPLAVAALLGLHGIAAEAQLVIKDTLTGASSSYDWVSLNGACLTAGDGTGSIPRCVGLPYYSGKTLVGGTTGRLPDAIGYGALRLSNGDTTAGSNGNNQTGAVVSNFTFPTNEGIQVTWTSVSYGGNNYNGTGADGISFFLSDGSQSPTVGALGGSLGYSCSNGNGTYDGVVGGYIGIGIDEFGNFSNPGDNTDTGPGFHPGRIGVRGAGSTAWSWLKASPTYGKYYPGSTSADAIHNTCRTGYAWNYSGTNQTDSNGSVISNGNKTHDKLPYNYPLLYSIDVPSGISLANQQSINMPTRGAAVPIIFSLKITADGLLDFSYSVNSGATQTVVTGLNITQSNGPLPGSFRFGFSAGTGGGSNVHEITCFKAEPANLSNSSAGSNVQQGQVIQGGSQVFLAFYHPVNWWGSITANALLYDSATNKLTAATVASWDGNCVLTGGACTTMTAANASTPVTVTGQAPSDRAVLTWNNGTSATGAGIAFNTFSSLPSAEQSSLGSQDEVDYLRGVRSREALNLPAGTAGALRNRTSVLGDIVDSSPVWVGPPTFNYASAWHDKVYTSASMPEASSYSAFASTYASRMNVVYVGANDGMLHAFRAGTTGSSGTLSGSDGHELLAYIPGQVISAIHPSSAALDYSNTQYQHNFQVDATPGMGDLYYGSAWHTWLVSGVGVGGHPGGAVNSNTATIAAPVSALFALDITDPSQFSETNAASLVIGEWTSATISCTGNATCGTNFGQTVGTPVIRRLHDGTWGVIWGNGLNSASGRAGIYILHVSSTGARTFQYIDAGPGAGNGIVQVGAADLDGDHVTDYVYAGDVLGNVWRFDLTSSTATTWNTSVTKIFSTASGQPITTSPLISAVPVDNSTGNPKVLVSFGTGQKLPLTLTSAEVFASGTQSLYGIWDANMAAWNATASDVKYDYLATPGQPVAMSALTAQSVTATTVGTDGKTYRSLSTTTICWMGSTACGAAASANTMLGWKLDLPGTGEQVIYDPVQIDDNFVVNTIIPQSLQPLTCGNTPATGFTMAPFITNGGGDNAPFGDGTNTYSAIGTNATGTASFYDANGNGQVGSQQNDRWAANPWNPKGGKLFRATWTKIR
jgi:type IV pilus assembly protein PilY1